jgi:hypothetical protein
MIYSKRLTSYFIIANNHCAMLIPFKIIPETKKLKVLFVVITNQVGFSKVSTKMNL